MIPGQKIGPYEILDLLGKGGMGEVYRTRDTRLKRDLAIKVLPDDVANDLERILRFQREAELLASLNHPNVAHLYGFEESGTTRCIVMELVEGATLQERMAQGPMLMAEALEIAKQITDAVEYAHEHGVIHRDLKPANIKITPEGQVKVLDFGLAKAMDIRTPISPPTLSNSPTLGIGATVTGFVLGTAAYMPPEQAKGRPVDRRADIWAFGVILYEMLTGRQMFAGETAPETMAFVMTRDPDWKALPATTPERLKELLRRCLTKDPRSRLQAIGDARILIEDLIARPEVAVPATAAPAPKKRSTLIPWAIAAILAVTATVAIWAPWRSVLPQFNPVLRLESTLGAEVQANGPLALSPDGRLIVFRGGFGGNAMLYLRRLDQLQAAPMPATANGRDPFFAPDSRSVGFFADGKLKKISLNGSAAVTLADAPDDRGGTWSEDNSIIFAPKQSGGLMRIPDGGGTPTPLTTLAGAEVTHRWPQALPGGKAVLFTVDTDTTSFNDATIAVQPFQGERKTVYEGGFFGHYLPSGHLAFANESTLFVIPFNLETMTVTQPPSPAISGISASLTNGTAQFSVSTAGSLLYVPGSSGPSEVQMLWLEKNGNVQPLRSEPGVYRDPRFSPDGKYVAVQMVENKSDDIWVYDWARDVMSRLTFDVTPDVDAVWTPDGRHLTYASTRNGDPSNNLFWIPSDGSGQPARLASSPNGQVPMSWRPDTKVLAFIEVRPDTRADIMMLPMDGDKPGTPTVFLGSPFSESEPAFSPDGKWLAYQSDESGVTEIYVRPYPGPGGRWQISSGGGAFPTWGKDGKQLYFRTRPPEEKIMVVPYSARGDAFNAEKPEVWSEGLLTERGGSVRNYDIHPDGKRALILRTPESVTRVDPNRFTFVLNFFQNLRRLNRGGR